MLWWSRFVFHTFRPEHPLLDLRLFKNRNLTVSIVTMFLFVAAFFGGLLLVPTYFQQVRGESALVAGLLVAPQGIGAMLTMPIAGNLSDRIPVGRIVPVGLVVIVIGFFGLTQVTATPPTRSYRRAFRAGPRHGRTMMPLFTAALKTLKAHEVARGSTLLNIIQQIGSSVGVAVISVILTAHLNASELAKPAMAATLDPSLTDAVGARGGGGGPCGCGGGLRRHVLGGLGPRRADPGAGVLPAAQARGGAAHRRGRPEGVPPVVLH